MLPDGSRTLQLLPRLCRLLRFDDELAAAPPAPLPASAPGVKDMDLPDGYPDSELKVMSSRFMSSSDSP